MKIRYAIPLGPFGKMSDKFTTYQGERNLEERFELASKVKGLEGLELVYPFEFEDRSLVKRLLERYNFKISAVNLNLKTEPRWRYGSLTAKSPQTRKEAVEAFKKAIDVSSEFGCNLVTCCLLNDGYDYLFQADYKRAWSNLVEGIKEVAEYRPEVKVSLEYKPCETRIHCFLSNVGKSLYLCSEVGLPNVGVTFDVGHALCAGEVPAESVALLLDKGKLFYVHVNDNFRTWDWDMIPGVVNLWDFMEVLLYLHKANYKGWFNADLFPVRLDPVKAFTLYIEYIELMVGLLEKMDPSKLFQRVEEEEVTETLSLIQDNLRKLLSKE